MASDCGYIVAQNQAPAGWYQESDGGWRYWNGAAWTNASPMASNAWPAPVNNAEQASSRTSSSVSRGQGVLATVCILLGLAFVGAMVQQPEGRTVVVGTTLAPRADSSTTMGTLAPATTFSVTSPRKPTPVTTAAVVENTVLAATAIPVATAPPLEVSVNPTTAVATTVSPTTAVATTVAPTTPPTYSQDQIAYFQAIERAAQSATSTTQPELVTPPQPSAGCGASSYTNSNGDCVPRPIAAPTAPSGATAKCKDGTFSFSKTRSGTCSSHKGVAEWL
jgi:hypothetical protein